MKNLIIALSVFFTAITSLSAQTATKKEVQKTMYVCPMHPNEVSTKEGRCSKCEMKMVKTLVSKHDPSIKGSQTKTKVVKKYMCTMDGATSNKPGKCPKCGMNMKEMNDQKMEENHKH